VAEIKAHPDPGDQIEFSSILPCSDDVCRANIALNVARMLPEVRERRRLTVIAGGPSAKYVLPCDGDTLALNGALSLFTKQGLAPTYWAACDPQPLVADFLISAPPSTTYLLAAKCDPAVFDRLERHDVRLWHVRDHPSSGKFRQATERSVTMSAIWMMYSSFDYTDFDIWGWDGCFIDGQHHAGDGEVGEREHTFLNYGGKIVPDAEAPEGVSVEGGRTFETTRTWAAEARGAEQFFQLAEYFDIGVTIHGDGMMNAARQSILGT
jgi:hypothetical protein